MDLAEASDLKLWWCFYLLFGNDECLLSSIFGFTFCASFYGIFERLEMSLDLINNYIAFSVDVIVYRVVSNLKLPSFACVFKPSQLRAVLDA